MQCGQEFDDGSERCPIDGTELATLARHLAPGTVLAGRYEIIAAVADGGMGKLYTARHKLMKRIVAVKTIHPSLVSSGAALQRFQQEAQAVSSLNHPNILTVFDFFVSDDGQPYLVMDYLQGTNLQEILEREHSLPVSRVVPIFMSVCAGLAHAHEHGVIHRDIKPANIMIVKFDGNDDFVKIVDFGIAKLSPPDGESSHLTATGDVFGSPQFMSPEQCRAKACDARSDVYSLGCVLYMALTSKKPFSGQDAMEIMYKHVHDAPPSLENACPDVQFSNEVRGIVAKAIATDPAERFQSMNEMRLALAFVKERMTGSRPVTVVAPIANLEPVTVSGAAARESSSERAPAKVDIRIVGIAALSIALLGIGLAMAPLQKTLPTVPAKAVSPTTAKTVQFSPVQQARQDAVPIPSHSQVSGSPQLQPQPQPQPQVSPEAMYDSDIAQGKKAFEQGRFEDAKEYFVNAHSLSEAFGEADSRYIDSLYWVSKAQLHCGHYAQAEEGLSWVVSVQKRRYGVRSQQVRSAEADLQSARRALQR